MPRNQPAPQYQPAQPPKTAVDGYGESLQYDPYANGYMQLPTKTQQQYTRGGAVEGLQRGALLGAFGGPIGAVAGGALGALGGYLGGKSKLNTAQQQYNIEQERAHQQILSNNALFSGYGKSVQDMIDAQGAFTPGVPTANVSSAPTKAGMDSLYNMQKDTTALANPRYENLMTNQHILGTLGNTPLYPEQQGQPTLLHDPYVDSGMQAPPIYQLGAEQQSAPTMADYNSAMGTTTPEQSLGLATAQNARQLLPSRIEKNNAQVNLIGQQTNLAGARTENVKGNTSLIPTKKQQLLADIAVKKRNAAAPYPSSGGQTSAASEKLQPLQSIVRDYGLSNEDAAVLYANPESASEIKLYRDPKGQPYTDAGGKPIYYKTPNFGKTKKSGSSISTTGLGSIMQ